MTKYKKLTHRERALLVHLSKGMTLTDAAVAAGYTSKAPGQAGHQAFEIIKSKAPEILEKYGLTDDVLIEKYLKPGLEAQETVFAKFEGKITDSRDVIAWGPRRDFLDMAFNLKGAYAPRESSKVSLSATEGSEIRVNIIHVGR